MNKFLGNVTKEKEIKIVNCAMDEFIKQGFNNASVNEILRKAGVTKEALFQSSLNKETLYKNIFEYAELKIKSYIIEKLDLSNNNLLGQIQSYMDQMIELLDVYPKTMKFLFSVIKDDNEFVKNEISKNSINTIKNIESYVFLPSIKAYLKIM